MAVTNRKMIFWIIVAMFLSLCIHMPYLNTDLVGRHVWRQAATTNTAISFFAEDINILNPRISNRGNGDGIFRMEFPLLQWMIGVGYRFAGMQLWVPRIIVFIIYCFGIVGFGLLCRAFFYSRLAGAAGAWVFCFSPEIFYFGINPLPDVLALSLLAWALYFLFFSYLKEKILFWYIGLIMLSLATLVKLPFVVFFAVPTAMLLFLQHKRPHRHSPVQMLVSLLLFFIIPWIWYLPIIPTWKGNGIVGGILTSSHSFASLARFAFHHMVSTLPELFINYGAMPFLIIAVYYFFRKKKMVDKRFLVLLPGFIAVIAYLIYELNMIELVHDYYLFPLYPFIIIAIVYGISMLIRLNSTGKFLSFFLLFALPLLAAIRTANSWNTQEPGFNADLLQFKEQLRQAVPDDALCVVGNDISQHIWFYYLNKKGWAFDGDNYDEVKLLEKINKGAQYLYSDSYSVESQPGVAELIGRQISSFGSIRVYLLRQTDKND